MSIWGNSFHNQWNPEQSIMPIPTGPTWGNPSQSPSNVMHAKPSMSDDVSSHTKSIHWPWPWFLPEPRLEAKLFLATWCQSNSRPLFLGYHQQPKLPFLATLHFLDLTRLLNDPIYHDPHWPPKLMKIPLDILKFEAKPNEDPGDHVTTFHIWCSSNSLKDDSV
jgi:hypothetical protein